MCFHFAELYQRGHHKIKTNFCINAALSSCRCEIEETSGYYMPAIVRPYGCGEAAKLEKMFWGMDDVGATEGYRAWKQYSYSLLLDDSTVERLRVERQTRVLWAIMERFRQMVLVEYCAVAAESTP